MFQALLASLLLTGTVAAPTAPIAPAAPATAPMTEAEMLRLSTDYWTRMTLPTLVNGKGPYAFTIDTAADRSVVSDVVANELALPKAGAATLYGIVGPTQVSLVTMDKFRIGRREKRRVDVPVLPREHLGAAGFIGVDALANEIVLLDFKRSQISIARSPEEAMEKEDGVIVVTGKSKFGQLVLTDARIGKTKIYAIIDTGAQTTIGNMAFRKLLTGRTQPIVDQDRYLIGVTGAHLPYENGHVARMELGDLIVVDLNVALADVQTFRKFGIDDKPALLIGMDVLRGFERVAIDFRKRNVRFLIGKGLYKEETRTAESKGTSGSLAL